VGGQERWGAEFFERHGLAEKVDAREQHLLAPRAFRMLEDRPRLERMREADEIVRAAYDLGQITAFFQKAVSTRAKKPSVAPESGSTVPPTAAAPTATPSAPSQSRALEVEDGVAYTWRKPAPKAVSETTAARGVDEAGCPRTALIFTAGFGGGHDSSKDAIRDKLLAVYPDLNVVVLNAQDYIHGAGIFPIIARASTFVFDKVYQFTPKLWDWLFQRTIDLADGKTSAGDIPVHLFSNRRILADLKKYKPDVIYSTYHLMTSRLIALRESGELNPDIPIAWLDTDFVQKPFYYLHSHGIDMTFIAHPILREERLALGVPADKMKATGLFINPFVFEPFSESQRREFMRTAMSVPDKVKAKQVDEQWVPTKQIWINGGLQDVDAATVQLDPNVMTVTIASGRAGVGDYPAIVEGLIQEARARKIPIQIVAVCGDNRKNYDKVTKLYRKLAARGEVGDVTLVVSRLVDNMKLMKLVRSSQLFIGKSGSQSPFEAAIMGVPRVLIDVIGGQERWTANFFKRLGLAWVVAAKEQKMLAKRAFEYLENDEAMAQMRVADQVIRDSYDLTPIPKFFEDAMAARKEKPSVEMQRPEAAPIQRRGFQTMCDDALTRVKSVFTGRPPR
jgi:UDP-N-acetylglucosamine:LPS N-acetylglucosamine transferase